MAEFLRQLDITWAMPISVSLGIVIAAVALRISCSACAIEIPSFPMAMMIVLFVLVVNVVLQIWLMAAQMPPGLGKHLVAPFIVTAAIVAVCLPTGPLNATMVTVVQGAICGLVYFLMGSAGALSVPAFAL